MALDIPFDNSYARLPDRFFARLEPEAVADPSLIALNDGLAGELGLDAAALRSPEGLAVLAGNAVAGGSEPLAMAYAGHQFGGWVPQLGDGRALLLGEVVDRSGMAARHPVERIGADTVFAHGRRPAWLGPVLREYIVSEAMAALGVPTTRACACLRRPCEPAPPARARVSFDPCRARVHGAPRGVLSALLTGEPVWHFQVNQDWKASPMTYVVGGKQYVAIASGMGFWAFALQD